MIIALQTIKTPEKDIKFKIDTKVVKGTDQRLSNARLSELFVIACIKESRVDRGQETKDAEEAQLTSKSA